MSGRLLKKIEGKIEVVEWPKAKDGRHVDRIFKNVTWDSLENARTYWTTAMGQWERSTTN